MSKPSTQPPASKGQIFALEAFEHVHRNQSDRYEEMGVRIDDEVKETEPGMLVHALTRSSESAEKIVYRWLEVFENPEALQAHVDNPLVQSHLALLSEGILCATTDVVIYADWDQTQKDYWSSVFSGANLVFAPMQAGFFLKR